MVTFVFLTHTEEKYSVGVLSESDSDLMVINNASPSVIKELIDSIPTKCIFVGKNLRGGVLQSLMFDLCKVKLPLPNGLKFHWVPPFNLNFDDINWLYNFGMYSEFNTDLEFMCESVGVELTGNELLDMANLYFTLVGDFRVIKLKQ